LTAKILQPTGVFEFRLSDVNWGGLEAAGKIELREEHRQRLLAAVNDYAGLRKVYQTSPLASEVRQCLEELATFVAISRRLLSVDRSVQSAAVRMIAIAAAARKETGVNWATMEARQSTLLTTLRVFLDERCRWEPLIHAAMAAVEAQRADLGGAPGDPFIGAFLVKAHLIYHQAGGRGTSTEAAKAFRLRAADIAGYHPQSAGALEQSFKRAWYNPPRNR
jgi:hypothetical protein